MDAFTLFKKYHAILFRYIQNKGFRCL